MTPAEPAPQEIAQLPLAALRRRMEARILGQEEFIEHMLIALLAGGPPAGGGCAGTGQDARGEGAQPLPEGQLSP